MPLRMRLVFDDIALSMVPIFGLLLMILPVVAWRRSRSFSYVLCVAVFGIYGLFVLDQVFFPMQVSGEYVEIMRDRDLFSGVNLIPLEFGRFGTLQSSLSTLLLNILLTVPFGFGIRFILPVRSETILWLAPAVGLSLELTQLIISILLQYPYRTVDIHDFLMNTLGVFVGYLLFRLFALGYVSLTNRLDIEHYGLSEYVFEVACQGSGTRTAATQ